MRRPLLLLAALVALVALTVGAPAPAGAQAEPDPTTTTTQAPTTTTTAAPTTTTTAAPTTTTTRPTTTTTASTTTSSSTTTTSTVAGTSSTTRTSTGGGDDTPVWLLAVAAIALVAAIGLLVLWLTQRDKAGARQATWVSRARDAVSSAGNVNAAAQATLVAGDPGSRAVAWNEFDRFTQDLATRLAELNATSADVGPATSSLVARLQSSLGGLASAVSADRNLHSRGDAVSPDQASATAGMVRSSLQSFNADTANLAGGLATPAR